MTIAAWTLATLALLWTWGMLGRIHNTLKEIQETMNNAAGIAKTKKSSY